MTRATSADTPLRVKLTPRASASSRAIHPRAWLGISYGPAGTG
jgi:hypothetical protein